MINSLCLPYKNLEKPLGIKVIRETTRPLPPMPDNTSIRHYVNLQQPYKSIILKLLRSLPQRISYDIFWLDFDTQPLYDWYQVKEILSFLCKYISEHFNSITGIGVASTCLIFPGNREGHISIEYLNYCFDTFPSKWQRWISVPLSPVYADYYRNPLFYLNSKGLTFFEVCNNVGFNLQADIPQKNDGLTKLFNSGILSDLPGSSQSRKLLSFINLFPQITRIRILDESYLSTKDLTEYFRKQEIALPVFHKKPCVKIDKAKPALKYSTRLPKVRNAIKAAYDDAILNRLELIELLSVLSGRKQVMRTSIKPANINPVTKFLRSYGIDFMESESRIKYRMDQGKGGWSNLYDPQSTESCRSKEFLIYIGLSKQIVSQALNLEKGDDDSFGDILSYPECCRASFCRNLPYAARKQGDIVPIIADQTPSSSPWNHLLNIGSRYFERSLISFYPCSYCCNKAMNSASETLRIVNKYIPEFKDELIDSLKSPIFYTEYLGVYMFFKAKCDKDTIAYSPDKLRMTTTNKIGEDLRKGDRIIINNMRSISIFKGKKEIRTVKGDNVRTLIYE